MNSDSLLVAFAELKPLFKAKEKKPNWPRHSRAELDSACNKLRQVFQNAKTTRGLINPWAIAGLKRNEVRNTSVLRGLWLSDFGGDLSRRFLGYYLVAAIPDVSWWEELENGYRVDVEINPLGEVADRVDLVVQTRSHLIGIEVKIDAALGAQQLERYVVALERRAVLDQLTPHVVFLSPFAAEVPGVVSTTWLDVSQAAENAINLPEIAFSNTAQLIAAFGEYVKDFS